MVLADHFKMTVEPFVPISCFGMAAKNRREIGDRDVRVPQTVHAILFNTLGQVLFQASEGALREPRFGGRFIPDVAGSARRDEACAIGLELGAWGSSARGCFSLGGLAQYRERRGFRAAGLQPATDGIPDADLSGRPCGMGVAA